jgi:hypothetical protein
MPLRRHHIVSQLINEDWRGVAPLDWTPEEVEKLELADLEGCDEDVHFDPSGTLAAVALGALRLAGDRPLSGEAADDLVARHLATLPVAPDDEGWSSETVRWVRGGWRQAGASVDLGDPILEHALISLRALELAGLLSDG